MRMFFKRLSILPSLLERGSYVEGSDWHEMGDPLDNIFWPAKLRASALEGQIGEHSGLLALNGHSAENIFVSAQRPNFFSAIIYYYQKEVLLPNGNQNSC
jgi:hypothetical protein